MTQAAPPAQRSKVPVIVVAAVAAVVLVGAGVFVAVRVLGGSTDNETPIRAAATVFLTSMRDGGDGAYDTLCTDKQFIFTRVELDRQRAKHALKAFTINAVTYANTGGVETGTVAAALTFAGGAQDHTIPMVRESGAWKVCGDPY